MRNLSNSIFLVSSLFFLIIPISYANSIGQAPVDYIHYVQAQKIKPAQPHVVLTKDCHLASDYISSTGGSSHTTCPEGFLPYQLTGGGAAFGGIGSRTYQLYCCKGEVSYS